MTSSDLVAIVPAAGIGSRMRADIPKQYLQIDGKTILTHTLERLLQHSAIRQIVVALHAQDRWFTDLSIASHPRIQTVTGGETRANSVMQALAVCNADDWALVHDAARPCVRLDDIDGLISACITMSSGGGILAAPVRDTMKRGDSGSVTHDESQQVKSTVDRTDLWHALTPQFFRAGQLLEAYQQALRDGVSITDEASAMEHCGYPVKLIASHPGNIKITHPDDLDLARFYLTQQKSLTQHKPEIH